MSLSKLFQRIIWHNNTTPAINEDNLNAMSKAIDDIDDRVILIGDDVVTVIPQIQAYLEQAESIVEAVEELSQNPPYIGANGNWYVFDTTLEAYKDSGVDASITVDIADITMIAEGAQPYVTNTGTSTDPIFHLFLPRSPQGATGNGIANIAKTGTQGLVDTYTITMTDGTTYTFTVTNGQGIGDMTKAVYDSTNVVADAGGITDYVEGKVEPILNVLGAKNLLPNEAVSQIRSGITFTVNDDGSITVNGTATAWAPCNIVDTLTLSAGKYVFTSENAIPANMWLTVQAVNGSSLGNITNGNNSLLFTLLEETTITVYIGLGVSAGTISNLVIKPMIRPASIEDDTYEPYSMTNQQLTPYAQSQSNPNLLDNPWFTVNQRGANSYTGNSSEHAYAIDRWYIYRYASDVTLTVNNDRTITLANTGSSDNQQVGQFLENALLVSGKTYTLSCDVVSYTGTVRMLFAGHNSPYPTVINKLLDSTGIVSKSGVYDGTSNKYKMAISLGANSSVTLRAVKLELGSVSTLAMDTAPNYTTELLKCQRYFHKYATQSSRPSNMYDCIPEMRANPTQSTIVIDGTTYYANSAEL